MSFIETVKSAIYDPDFYENIKKRKLSTTLKYFFLLILALTTINTIILAYELGVKAPQEIRDSVYQGVSSFPADLEVNIDEGQVTTTAQEPFFVPMPKQETEEYKGMNNLLVIDTKTPYSSTQFNQYKTLMWLTKDSLFYANREFDNRSVSLTDVENIKINKQFVQDLAGKINPWLNFVGPVLIILTFIGLYLGFTFNLIYFLLLAVLVFFLSKIFKWGLGYSASYKTAVYASTLAFIVDLTLFNTGLYTGFFGFPFLFTLTTLCVVTINLQNFERKG